MSITGSIAIRNVTKRAIETLLEPQVNNRTPDTEHNKKKYLPKLFIEANLREFSKNSENETKSSFWLNPWLLMAKKITNYGLPIIKKGI